MSARRRRILLIYFTAFLVAWAGLLVYLAFERSRAGNAGTAVRVAISVPKTGPFRGNQLPDGVAGRQAPDFRLTDARGGVIDTRKLLGRPYALTFLYTDCKDTCPLIAAELRQALKRLGPRSREVTVVAVTAKPEVDTRAAVQRWLLRKRMPNNFRYAIGSEADVKPVWKSYFAAPQGNENEPHSSSIWLVDARGRWRTKFSASSPVPPADIAHDLGVLLDEAKRS